MSRILLRNSICNKMDVTVLFLVLCILINFIKSKDMQGRLLVLHKITVDTSFKLTFEALITGAHSPQTSRSDSWSLYLYTYTRHSFSEYVQEEIEGLLSVSTITRPRPYNIFYCRHKIKVCNYYYFIHFLLYSFLF